MICSRYSTRSALPWRRRPWPSSRPVVTGLQPTGICGSVPVSGMPSRAPVDPPDETLPAQPRQGSGGSATEVTNETRLSAARRTAISEVTGRDAATRRMRRKTAASPSGKTFSSWRAEGSSIPEATQNALATLEWIGRAENLVIAGPSGTGKSHLVEALAHAAILREVGVVPAPQVNASPTESLLERYRSWMESERGLSASTMLRHENTARRFLAEQAMAGGVFAPDGLTGADLNAFLLRECARVSAGSAKGRVAELRSLMRFLHLHGVTATKLGGAVPPVGGWRFASVQPTMAPGDVQRLLDHRPRPGHPAQAVRQADRHLPDRR